MCWKTNQLGQECILPFALLGFRAISLIFVICHYNLISLAQTVQCRELPAPAWPTVLTKATSASALLQLGASSLLPACASPTIRNLPTCHPHTTWGLSRKAHSQNLGSIQVEVRTNVTDPCSIPRTRTPWTPSASGEMAQNLVSFQSTPRGKRASISMQSVFVLHVLYFIFYESMPTFSH